MSKVDAWASFFKSYNRLHEKMERSLKEQGFPSLTVYDVLWILENSPDYRLRFNDLGDKVYLSRYNITRLCERLELEGLIKRVKCLEDKRGVFAELTNKGIKVRQSIWKSYGPLIQELFSQKLTQNEHHQLILILKKVWSE